MVNLPAPKEDRRCDRESDGGRTPRDISCSDRQNVREAVRRFRCAEKRNEQPGAKSNRVAQVIYSARSLEAAEYRRTPPEGGPHRGFAQTLCLLHRSSSPRRAAFHRFIVNTVIPRLKRWGVTAPVNGRQSLAFLRQEFREETHAKPRRRGIFFRIPSRTLLYRSTLEERPDLGCAKSPSSGAAA